jgi:hypothetical protein
MKTVAIVILIGLLIACSPAQEEQEKIWIAGWKEASSMNVARAGAAMVEHNNFVYMLAGVDGRKFLRSIEYAPILPDGRLGEWKMAPSLVVERGFTEAVVYNNYLYVVGGGNGPNGKHLLHSVERAKINPDDGSLGPWRLESNQTILPRRCTKLALIGDKLYSFGGFGGALLDSVEFARINPDGSVGQWQAASEPMTMPRYVNSVKAVDGAAYVIGGHDQRKGVGITDVEWTRPQAGGDLRGWQPTSSLLTGRYGLASAKHSNTLYAIGGLTGLEYLAGIEKADVLPEGGLSSWEETTPMSIPRATFSALAHGDHLYVLGGTNVDGYLRSVEYTEINNEGDPGFFGTAQERDAYQVRMQALAAARPQLPNEGVVKQVLHAEMYSYVQIRTAEDRVTWLAGPKTELPIDSRIRYSKGVRMNNFYSKELQRPFPEVTFVSQIEKVE